MDRPITSNMRIEDVLVRHPATAQVFQRYGLHCHDCHVARFESIAEGARVHDLSLDGLLEALNQAAERGHARPWATLPVRR